MELATCVAAATSCLKVQVGNAVTIFEKKIMERAMAKIQDVAAQLCQPQESTIGKAQEEKMSLEATLSGEVIVKEFSDTRLSKTLDVTTYTMSAKDLVKKCPIFFFGRTRQGKSTCINNLMQLLGSASRPASEDHMKPCTRGVDMHRLRCTAWTTPGMEEELLLFDTEGWEFGKKACNLFAQCITKAEEEKIRPEVLHQRLVLVLVLDVEHRSEIYDSKFRELVKAVCCQASKAAHEAGGGRPVLLPVVSKEDLIANPDIQTRISSEFKSALKEVVVEMMNVHSPVFIRHDREPANLKWALSTICGEQLKSPAILQAVRESMEESLQGSLQDWEEQGLESGYSMRRRFLWVVARHRGLYIKDVSPPRLSWKDVAKYVGELRTFSQSSPLGKEDWHTDPLRNLNAGRSRLNSLSTCAGSER
mmetsp:Transcript_122114/g.290325  ORF Transcript_122114/g.290325 Transcript_122114/m.290325 type:complete len:420 (-) Transcript_122114:54-1313(-)